MTDTDGVFKKLISEFCALFKLESPELAIEGKWIMANEVAFSFSHFLYEKNPAVPMISIYVDFGPVPSKKEAEIHRVLLETNLMLQIKQGPVFSISPKEKHVICAYCHPSESMQAEDLSDLILNLSSIAHEWRKTYFLDIKGDRMRESAAARFSSFRNSK